MGKGGKETGTNFGLFLSYTSLFRGFTLQKEGKREKKNANLVQISLSNSFAIYLENQVSTSSPVFYGRLR